MLIILGFIMSLVHGSLLPLFCIFWGDLVDSLTCQDGGTSGNPSNCESDVTKAALRSATDRIAVKFLYLGAGAVVSAYFQVFCFILSSVRQGRILRRTYFRALLSQEMGWYDVNKTGELVTRMASDTMLVQAAIADKVGTFVQFFGTFLAGFIIGFVQGWELSLVILAVTPLLAISGALMGKVISGVAKQGQDAYAKAGGIVCEALSSIRTVVSLGAEERESRRYNGQLVEAKRVGVKGGISSGIMMGLTFLLIFLVYALAFWYGNRLVGDVYTRGDIVSIFFAIVIGAMAIGQAAPSIQTFNDGVGAAHSIFETIDRIPEIDSFSEGGEKPDQVKGHIQFKDIRFIYPTRPGVNVLDGLSIDVPVGATVAFVGHSGCGKSTIISILERFYNLYGGHVLLDGRDITTLNTEWLRSKIGFVSQEPCLFATTIAENISYGAEKGVVVTREMIENAAREANAHEFISSLPRGYETYVGDMGTQLSGGQKQRIAIARALVRDPKILLLDEATSALDTQSEKIVQAALDKVKHGRTTLVIAHRLSTIRDADVIAVIDKGVVAEQGTHDELLKLGGLYSKLVSAQEFSSNDGCDADVKEDTALNGMKMIREERPMSLELRRASKHSMPAYDADAAAKIDEDTVELSSGQAFKRALSLNMNELPSIILGSIFAVGNGLTWPMFAIIFSTIITVLGDDDSKVSFWSLMFVVIAVSSFIVNLFSAAFFAHSGEALTERLRAKSFRSLLYQEVSFYDDEKNNVSILVSKLAVDASLVKGLTGLRLNAIVTALGTMIGGIVIAFAECWRLALVILACVPLIAGGGALEMKMFKGFDSNTKKFDESSDNATEIISNIRTVSSLGRGRFFLDKYDALLDMPTNLGKRASFVMGVGFALSQFSIFAVWAITFFYAGFLIEHKLCNFESVMKAQAALIFSGMMMGQAASLAPDAGKAMKACSRIFFLLDRVSSIDASLESGDMLTSVEGNLEFNDVKFNYSSRPDIKVLDGLNFSVKTGQTLALVGPSGCGKSTCISLIERFYDPVAGVVKLDGVDTTSLKLSWLRDQIGLVSQEPILFSNTIAANIRFGIRDSDSVTHEMVEAAAKLANAHDFITAMPDGYQTICGEKGAQLSGGQKQRIAIARALVRDPKILLLDEATSALDTDSEKIVQEALDNARKGRTTIVIAHRLSTIQSADIICVVDAGRIVEQGNHSDLMNCGGIYSQLVQNQSLGTHSQTSS